MSEEEATPQAEAPLAPPAPAVEMTDQSAVVEAEKAVTLAREARDAYAKQLAEMEARIDAKLATVAPEGIEEVKAYMVRERNQRRVQVAIEMGLDAIADNGQRRLTDEQILRLVPDVDPSDPAGRTQFAAFQAAHPGLFRARGVDYQRVAEDITAELSAKKHPLFSGERLARSVFGSKK